MSMELVINPKGKKKAEQNPATNPKKKGKKKNSMTLKLKKIKVGRRDVYVLADNPEYKVSITKLKRKRNPTRKSGLIAIGMKDITSGKGLIWVAGGYALNRFGSSKIAGMVENIPGVGMIVDKLGEKSVIPITSFGVSVFMKGQMKKNLQLLAVGSAIDWILAKVIGPHSVGGTGSGVSGLDYAPVYDSVSNATSEFVSNVNNAVNSIKDALDGLPV